MFLLLLLHLLLHPFSTFSSTSFCFLSVINNGWHFSSTFFKFSTLPSFFLSFRNLFRIFLTCLLTFSRSSLSCKCFMAFVLCVHYVVPRYFLWYFTCYLMAYYGYFSWYFKKIFGRYIVTFKFIKSSVLFNMILILLIFNYTLRVLDAQGKRQKKWNGLWRVIHQSDRRGQQYNNK